MDWLAMEEMFSLEDFSNNNTVDFDHPDLTERLKKTFYYSPHKNPSKDTLSFPLTKAAVESFRKAAPSPCGKLGPRYASRVARDACLSPCAMVLSLIYVERLIRKNPEYLQRIQSSDLFLISMMIASKYLYDEGASDEVYNDEWAISSLVETDHVNQLEAEFLHAIDWKIFTRKEEFYESLSLLEAKLAYLEGNQRGWLTYTELDGILASKRINDNFKRIATLFAKAICLSAVVYSGLIFMSLGLVALLRQPVVQPPKDVSGNVSVNLNDSEKIQATELVVTHSSSIDEQVSLELPKLPESHPAIPTTTHKRVLHKPDSNCTQTHHSMSPHTYYPFTSCRNFNVTSSATDQTLFNSISKPLYRRDTSEYERFRTGSDPPIPSYAGILSLTHPPLLYQQRCTLATGKVF